MGMMVSRRVAVFGGGGVVIGVVVAVAVAAAAVAVVLALGLWSEREAVVMQREGRLLDVWLLVKVGK